MDNSLGSGEDGPPMSDQAPSHWLQRRGGQRGGLAPSQQSLTHAAAAYPSADQSHRVLDGIPRIRMRPASDAR
jgi:hypothetical protein